MRRSALAVFAALACLSTAARAQEKEDRTLLTWEQMRAIIMEASGERAMHHVLEFVPYQRVRPSVRIHDRPVPRERVTARVREGVRVLDRRDREVPRRPLWQPTKGQLWVSEKLGPRKLYDIYDTPVALGGNTPTGDVSGELVDVGNGGRAEDYAGKDVKGKVVLGSAALNALQRLAVFERGAVGVLSWNSMRPIAAARHHDFLVDRRRQSRRRKPRLRVDGHDAHGARPRRRASRRGEKITIRSVVEAQTYPGRQEVIHATIAGDGSTNQDVDRLRAHLRGADQAGRQRRQLRRGAHSRDGPRVHRSS